MVGKFKKPGKKKKAKPIKKVVPKPKAKKKKEPPRPRPPEIKPAELSITPIKKEMYYPKMPKPLVTENKVSYGDGEKLDIDIEQTDTYVISASKGPVVDGTRREVHILPPFAKISTTATSDFSTGTATDDAFYIGTAEIKSADGTETEITYEKALIMKESPTSDHYTVIPLEEADMTFQEGTPLSADIEMISDYHISASKGPLVEGERKEVTVFAPYVKISSGETGGTFSIAGATDNAFYYGAVSVGGVEYDRAIVIKEAPTSDYFRVIVLE
jgi:hypothetical protein